MTQAIGDFLAQLGAAPAAPAASPAAAPAAAPVEAPAALPPMPDMIRDLILAPPEGSDPVAAIKAFGLSCEIPPSFLASICSSPGEGYTPEQVATIAAMPGVAECLAPPAPVEVEPVAQPLVSATVAAETPAPKKTRRSRKVKDGAPLTREERLALACAAVSNPNAVEIYQMGLDKFGAFVEGEKA